jgi:hypothetical protein
MLELKEQRVKQLALSRNHENAGDDKVAYMSIAYTEVELNEDQVDGLMGKFTWRSWFNKNGADIQPLEWTKRVELSCEDKFKDVSVTMKFDKKELEFDGCRLYIDKFKLLSGGAVMTDLHIHVLKAKDSEWNLVGQHEFTEVHLSLGDGVVIERKSRKQRELPLEGGEDVGGDTDAQSKGSTTPLTGAHVVVGGAEPAVRSEGGQVAAEEAGSADDANDFEKGLADAVGAHKKRGSNVIDGRSERVKHQDRRAGRDDAH